MPRAARLSLARLRRGLRALALAAGLPLAAAAQEVTLESLDGSIEVTGQVIDHDGTYWRIASAYGHLTLRADRVCCAGEGCPDGRFVPKIAVTGADASVSLLWPALLAGFAAERGFALDRADDGLFRTEFTLTDEDGPLVRFATVAATSARAYADLAAGDAALALTLRPPLEDEAAGFGEAGVPRAQVLALDALVLTGGGEGPFDLFAPGAAEGIAFPDPATGVPALFGEMTGQVAGAGGGPAALAFLSAAPDAPRGVVDACGALRVADPFTVGTGSYPLSLAHRAVTGPGRVPRVVAEILDFAGSAPGRAALSSRGFLSPAPVWRGLEEDGARLLRAIAAATGDVTTADLRRVTGVLGPARQASVVVGFDTADDRPDPAAMGRLRALVARLDEDGGTGRLILAGFGDAGGSAAANRAVSLDRARRVAEEVRGWLGGDTGLEIDPRGFGEAFPAACNDTPEGRARNRRVEVWVVQR